jgi:acetyl esterase/lipase
MDAKRLAGFGYSAGAQLICVLGFDARQVDRQAVAAGPTPPQLQAVVAGGTPCDLAQGTRCGLLRYVYLGGTPEQHPERYRQASPVTYLSASCPPTFFYHGTVDRMVGANGVLAVSRRLQELGVRCEVYRVPGKGHIAAFGDDTAIQKAADFLNDVLEPTAETTPGNSEEPK